MTDTALILAGGLGTRLRSVVADAPKCMAPVAGKPFLQYLIDFYLQQNIRHFVFSLGYKHEQVTQFLHDNYPELSYEYVVEKEPLGTGGAIHFALKAVQVPDILILNGDTFFGVSVAGLDAVHRNGNADCTIALKPMTNIDRYGVVEMDERGSITAFREKRPYAKGLINAGVYMLKVDSFLSGDWPEKFSFETDFLQSSTTHRLLGYTSDAYFIDIGIPEDYARAQTELPEHILLDI